MKGLMPFVLGICLLIAAAVVMANWDPITPAVVEARANTSVGVTEMNVLNEGMVFVLKWIGGATLAGLAGAAFVEGRKIYRHWWIGQTTRRGPWKSGPNAQYQQQQKLPKLTREDMLLMALANRDRRVPSVRSMRTPRSTFHDQEVNDEIEIDL